MKKAAKILLLTVYLIFTIGVNTSFILCNDEIQSVKLVLSIPEEENCNCCGMCEKSCCETEIKTTKLEDSQNVETINTVSSQKIVIAVLNENDFNLNARKNIKSILSVAPKPPPTKDIILIKSSFLI